MGDNNNAPKLCLAWLDNSATEENSVAQEQLTQLDNNFKMLKTIDECNVYVNSLPSDAGLTLIVNGTLGKEIVHTIHSLPQIIAIYVYCLNKELHVQWASKINKVKHVITDFNQLKTALQPNSSTKNVHKSIITSVSTADEVPTPDTTAITDASSIIDTSAAGDTLPVTDTTATTGALSASDALPVTDTTTTMDVSPVTIPEISQNYAVDCSYMISDNCFDFITRMKLLPTEKDDFIAFCLDALKGNEPLLAIIREFQDAYTASQATSWLYRHPFFIGFIDNIFKYSSVGAMFPCRLFINDVYKHLKQHQCTSAIQVYQCELITNEMFQQLKDFNGKVIAMKSFYLANLSRETIDSYINTLEKSDNHKRVLFIIDANPQTKDVKPFAKIDLSTDTIDSNSVLFMIGSLFKITEIQDEKDGIIIIKMSLCAYDDENMLNDLFHQLKAVHIDQNGETDAIGFGKFLLAMSNSINSREICDAGENIIQSCLEKLPADSLERSRCCDTLGELSFLKGELDKSLDFYQKSFQIKEKKLLKNDPNIAESYKYFALVFLAKNNYTTAHNYFKLLLELWKQLHGDDHQCLAFCYTHIASIYQAEEKISEAISYYYQALAIMVLKSENDYPALAVLYNNLGIVHACNQQYHLALGYYQTSLDIKLQLYGSEHPSVAITYKNIGLVYEYMQDIQKSRENLEKALAIYRQLPASAGPPITEIETLIQNLPTSTT